MGPLAFGGIGLLILLALAGRRKKPEAPPVIPAAPPSVTPRPIPGMAPPTPEERIGIDVIRGGIEGAVSELVRAAQADMNRALANDLEIPYAPIPVDGVPGPQTCGAQAFLNATIGYPMHIDCTGIKGQPPVPMSVGGGIAAGAERGVAETAEDIAKQIARGGAGGGGG